MDERQLKELMAGTESAPPRDAARERAISQAMNAFDAVQQEKQKKFQGSGLLGRLKDRLTDFKRRRSMTPRTLTQKYGFAGMATATAVLLAMVTYNTFDPYLGAEKSLPEPIVETPKAETKQAPAAEAQTPSIVFRGSPRKSEPKAKSDSSNISGLRRAGEDITAKTYQPPQAVVTTPRAAPPAMVAPSPAVRQRLSQRLEGKGAVKLPEATSGIRGLMGGSVVNPLLRDSVPNQYETSGRDQFENADQNPINLVAENPVSTFSVDVDTAAYSFMRRMLNRGVLPQKNAVRIEELINYFPYAYPKPATRERPFQSTVTVTPSPWKKGNKLIHIGIKGYDLHPVEKPRSNLVFLLDVSGSMNATDKLPLLVNSMKLLLDTLRDDDTVAIVVYAGAAGTVLEPTKVSEKHKILAALDQLRAGGSTAGAAGVRQAYALAERQFDKEAVNRVILATDGDFNIGITNREELKGFIERKRKTGIFLSVLGFGQGNLNDHLMQTLAQNGNGVAAHIDTLSEARKVLVEESSSTLFPIAKDVKIQVEFNPKSVAEYRLIGYETRALKREDFHNDKVDAGDIGAGHTVTAIYEITPVGGTNRLLEDSRYKSDESAAASNSPHSDEYAFLKIRYKLPKSEKSNSFTTAIIPADEGTGSSEVQWATAVAGFGQILKGGKYTGSFSYDDVLALAKTAKGEDEFGYRAEFLNLVRLARTASAMPRK